MNYDILIANLRVIDGIDNTPVNLDYDYIVKVLKRMFKSKQDYAYYMNTLRLFRNLLSDHLEYETPEGTSIDTGHPCYPLWDVVNNLVGVLYDPRVW